MYLVGAGPGDPGLITVKGYRLLRQANVVIYDRLADRRLLEAASPSAELIDVGKARGSRQLGQEDLNQLLVEMAQQGKMVVRLKGGDPFVFGRGSEEAEVLAAAGVPFEVIPGITSAIAVPAYAGIPLTHRHVASSFTVVSGSEDPSKTESNIDWDRLATGAGTLVVLMGWESLPNIVTTLKAHGMALTMPAALIQWGTRSYQRTIVGTLSDILDKGQVARLTPPVIAVFGKVVELREKIRWFDNRPLFGKRVLVPRTRAQAGALSQALAAQGAEPVEVPTIDVQPLDDHTRLDAALLTLSRYRWTVFSSANGVNEVFRRLDQLAMDARAFGGTKVCAIGPATTAALKERGIRPDMTPRDAVSEGIVQSLVEAGVKGQPVLLLRAEAGRDVLSLGLSQAGAKVEDVAVYRTVLPDGAKEAATVLAANGTIDAVVFTSSSTVKNLVALLGGDPTYLKKMTLACIGPVTADTAREMGLTVDVMSKEPTVESLVDSLAQHFSKAEGN